MTPAAYAEVVVERNAVSLPPLVEPIASLSEAQRSRYARHLALPAIGELGQRRLLNASVLCIGAGGLGSPALLYLAAAGVGTIGIVDFDRVDESNLHRQVIHGQSDIGRPKIESAADTLREVNPDLRVVLHPERLDASNAISIMSAYDVVVDGSDNFATRYLANDTCVLLHKPYVWGSVYRFDGQVSVFWADHGPCYRCLHPTPPPPGLVPSCAEGGVLGALCGSIGSMQATEAIKLIAGVGDPLVGRVLTHDSLALSSSVIDVRKNPRCAICGDEPTITALIDYDAFCAGPSSPDTLTACELAAWVDERSRGDRDFVLVDVREPAEHAADAIPDSVLVPLGAFRDGSAFAALPADRQVVLYCKVGVRSGHALELARRAGFDRIAHVAGGIDAWNARRP